MLKITDRRKIYKVTLWATGMIILLLLTIMWYWVVAFDTESESINNTDKQNKVLLTGLSDINISDSWNTIIMNSLNKNDYEPYIGSTCNCTIENNNYFHIKDWELRLEINQECYLSSFWCGAFEIHQFRDGEELNNFLLNQSADISNLNIDRNLYSDTMLIHLMPGDYLVYYPSKEQHEDIVETRMSVGIGFIFYYQKNLDLSNWTLTYKNDLKLRNLIYFKILIALVIIWLAAFILYFTLETMSKRIKDEMNKRIRNVSIMADLYIEAYMINIDEDTGHLIKGDESKLIIDLVGRNIQEKLNSKILSSCQEAYITDLKEFLNLNTVISRMENSSNIMMEFVDKNIGWCAIRIFKASEDNNQIVLTLQDINEEKRKISIIEDRMNMAEFKHNVGGSFLETVSFALNNIAAKINMDGRSILEEKSDEEIHKLANAVIFNTRHMNLIQNTMIDLYAIECKKLILNIETYNIYDMVEELINILSPFAEGKAYDFNVDVDKNLPKAMKGDRNRIEQIIVIILFSSMLMTQKGFVTFSIYGKRRENYEELIFSVRDSAFGFSEQQLIEIHDFINGSSIETFDNASLVYLKIMNGILNYMDSELKIVSVENEGSDFYFSLKQEIVE